MSYISFIQRSFAETYLSLLMTWILLGFGARRCAHCPATGSFLLMMMILNIDALFMHDFQCRETERGPQTLFSLFLLLLDRSLCCSQRTSVSVSHKRTVKDLGNHMIRVC